MLSSKGNILIRLETVDRHFLSGSLLSAPLNQKSVFASSDLIYVFKVRKLTGRGPFSNVAESCHI